MLFCSTFTLAVTAVMFPSEDIMGDGASACPAFTSAMVDAAAMAFGLFPDAVVTAGDDPTIPSIFCYLDSGDGSDEFILEVNISVPYEAMAWAFVSYALTGRPEKRPGVTALPALNIPKESYTRCIAQSPPV